MSFSELIDDYWNDRAQSMQVGLVATIEKFEKGKMRADVKPLLKLKNSLGDETDYPVLSDVPVSFLHAGGFYVRPEYERGDYVWVTFATNDISNSLDGNTRAASDKKFSLENACVVNGIAKNNFSAPSEFDSEDGLLIGHKDGNSYMVFSDDKIVFKTNQNEVEIGDNGILCKKDNTEYAKIQSDEVLFEISGKKMKLDDTKFDVNDGNLEVT
jgi:hypothetical protein